jgi:uncharacterized protein YjbI with pentapeptide repeats
MKFEIKNRWNGSLIFGTEANSLKLAVEQAVISKVSLRDAVLRGADLRYAVLSGAVMSSAILIGADMSDADLSDADLSGAVLSDADLSGAVLSDAVLIGAVMSGDCTMADGLKFSQYVNDVVPALLTAGGKTLETILASGCWECHSWNNCPMAVAFGIDAPSKGPPLLRARIKEFVQLFDAKLIPKPTLQSQERP